MPFARPTPQQLRDRIATEIELAFPGADARARRSIEGVVARMLAIASHELHGHLDWNADTLLPDTAERAELERHASIWGIARKGAVAAAGAVVLAGTAGAAVPEGTRLRRADGTLYATTGAALLGAGGTAIVPVQAEAAGPDGDAPAGTRLTLQSPLAGVSSQANVPSPGLGGGLGTEGEEALLARLLDRIQRPPHGGNANDYRTWALEVPGTTRAWVFPGWMGAGTVGVAVAADEAETAPIPGQELVQAVAAHIDPLRPVTAEVFVFAPTPLAVDFQISLGVQGASETAAVQAAVEAELRALFRREAAPGGALYLSRLSEAVSRAAGEFRHVLVLPAADLVPEPGVMPVVGAVAWGSL